MKKDHQIRLGILLICVLCFMTLIIHATWGFEKQISNTGLESKREELQKTAWLNGRAIQNKYENMVGALKSVADGVKEMRGREVQFINSFADLDYFDYIGISDENGVAVDSQKRRLNIKERAYFQEAMQGNVSISDVLRSKVIEGDEVQIMAVPIMKDGIARGVVFGILNVKMVDASIETVTGSNIYTQILDSEGNPVVYMKEERWIQEYQNIWEYFQECEFIDGSIEKLKKDIEAQESGYYTVNFQGETKATYYMPLGIKGYYIYSTVDVRHLERWLEDINREALFMAAEIIIAFILLSCTVFWYHHSMQKELQKVYKKAVSNEEVMKIAARQSQKLIFEYDIRNNILKRIAGVNHILFPNAVMEKIPESVLETGVLAENSSREFENLFQEIQKKEDLSIVVETKKDGESRWFRIIMKNVYDSRQQIVNTVGVVEEVTDIKLQEAIVREEKRNREAMRDRAERDGLTGLYNALTAKEKISQILKDQHQEGKQILVLMDLDNFKNINDNFGHQYGDRVIREMAEILSRKFRKGDIIARLGGDEFAAFLLNTDGFEKMEHIFKELVRECEKEYEKDGQKVIVSASFGIAVASAPGENYQELFQKADQMLYEVKRDNKKGYKVYKE